MIPKGIIWKIEYQCVVSGEHSKNKARRRILYYILSNDDIPVNGNKTIGHFCTYPLQTISEICNL